MRRSAWLVVLAGGDGRRLERACIRGRSLDRPKQFCCLDGSESMLGRTLRRAARITTPERIIAVVRDDHRHWWQDELGHLPPGAIVSEVANRGTAVAILDALVHVLLSDADPTLVFLPSDHVAEDEQALADSIEWAAEWAAVNRDDLMVLGMTPDGPESQYGWILPRAGGAGRVQGVVRFVEKPGVDLTAELLGAGALWNSFICAGSGQVLLDLFEQCQPELLRRFLGHFLARATNDPASRLKFLSLPRVDFCRDIMESAAARLRVLVVPACGWTDLGTPLRVDQWLHRRRHPPHCSCAKRVPSRATRGTTGRVLGTL